MNTTLSRLAIADHGIKSPMSFMGACKSYFGLQEGQSAVNFAKEVRALTPADRTELVPQLETQLGISIQA